MALPFAQALEALSFHLDYGSGRRLLFKAWPCPRLILGWNIGNDASEVETVETFRAAPELPPRSCRHGCRQLCNKAPGTNTRLRNSICHRNGATQGCALREAGRGPRLCPLKTYGGHSSEKHRAPNRASGRGVAQDVQAAAHRAAKKVKKRSLPPQMNCMLLPNLNVTFRPSAYDVTMLRRSGMGLDTMAGNAHHVLVIEDDAETAEQVADCLRTNGYAIDLSTDGEDGLRRGLAANYVVITVDRMLPRIDGIEVIRRLRERGIATPALIVSALGEVDDRVRGLRAGGDDYLVKPFASQEMVARVDALARRSGTVVKETILRVGDLEIDLLERIARRRGQKIELLPREFKLLEYLARNVGQVVSRAMLLQHVWDLHFDPTTNVIDVYVGRVRRKIDIDQAYPLIHTIRGVGFCLRAPE
jgi:two-component system, OmpR family, response regulator